VSIRVDRCITCLKISPKAVKFGVFTVRIRVRVRVRVRDRVSVRDRG
jgi:hypothetical protein